MSSLQYNLQEVHLPICSQEMKWYILGFKYRRQLNFYRLLMVNVPRIKLGMELTGNIHWTPTYITFKLQVQHWVQFSEYFSNLKTRCNRVFIFKAGYEGWARLIGTTCSIVWLGPWGSVLNFYSKVNIPVWQVPLAIHDNPWIQKFDQSWIAPTSSLFNSHKCTNPTNTKVRSITLWSSRCSFAY